jgi:hypothetical protein
VTFCQLSAAASPGRLTVNLSRSVQTGFEKTSRKITQVFSDNPQAMAGLHRRALAFSCRAAQLRAHGLAV